MSGESQHFNDPLARPVGCPIGSNALLGSSLGDGPREDDSTDDIVPPQLTRTRRSSGSKRIALDSIDETDRMVLEVVQHFRVMTGGQLTRALFENDTAGQRAARRRLLRLTKSGLLDRLERRIGGVRGGSAGFLYVLGLEGQRLLGDGTRRTRRFHEPGWMLLKHTVAISELFAELSERVRSHPGASLVEFVPEPLAWRRHSSTSGVLELRPDAYLVLDVGTRRQYWFIEVDLGTESAKVLKRKLAQYYTWLLSGHEQEHLGGVFPRVLWHTDAEPRRQQIEQLVASAPGPAGLHVTSGLLEQFDAARPPPDE